VSVILRLGAIVTYLHKAVFARVFSALYPSQLCQSSESVNSRWLSVLFNDETCKPRYPRDRLGCPTADSQQHATVPLL
jgi:hypothetical protein